VANVASIYGAYLKEFKTTATNLLHLHVIPPSKRKAEVVQLDTQVLALDSTRITPDTILYLDPPYNQRQYGANYFPLNAVADINTDHLNVNGITGIPADGYKKSAWCSKRTVSQSLKTILEGTPARRLALSYNQEGLLTHTEIAALFVAADWRYKRVEIPYKRFASQKDLEQTTVEYLFLAERK
jgi:adenine-specific DNA-methyltransferase